jgi:hypothetical protein
MEGLEKMATVTQMQTAWALWIRDLAETLETHLVEVKHKGELKLGHPEPLAHGRLLHAEPLAASSKCPWETFSRPNRWAPSIMQYPSATPGINQHNPLDSLTCNPQKKKKLNKQWNWKESKMVTGTQLQTV